MTTKSKLTGKEEDRLINCVIKHAVDKICTTDTLRPLCSECDLSSTGPPKKYTDSSIVTLQVLAL